MPQYKRKKNPLKYYTASGIARLMGLHFNTVLWNIRQGYLNAEFDGYRYLIKPEDYQEWRERYYEPEEEDDEIRKG